MSHIYILCVAGSAAPEQLSAFNILFLATTCTSGEPLPVRTITHRMPRGLIDRIIEPMSRLKFLFNIFTLSVRRRVGGEIELSQSSVRRIRYQTASRFRKI